MNGDALRRVSSLAWLALPLAAGATATSRPALALSIELKDVAPDRIERQRAAEAGRLPLPGTPDMAYLQERLEGQGLKSGSPVLMRLFKAEQQLEIWIEKENSYVLFASYPICNWSGTLGPKLREGDRQTPEGFYTITSRQLQRFGRWPRALNLGYPNSFDRAHDRTGSYILMHGGCSSVGCVAMTNPVIAEIYGLVAAAMRGGNRYVPVHVFPFRMTEENLSARKSSEWQSFWLDLKEGYESFERTHRPPRISMCEGRYRIEDASVEEASKPKDAESSHKKGRRYSAAGSIREACPEPLVTASESRPELAAEHMSRLGGPLPSASAPPSGR